MKTPVTLSEESLQPKKSLQLNENLQPSKNFQPQEKPLLTALQPHQRSLTTGSVIDNLSQMVKQAEGVTYYAVPGYN